MTFQDIIQSDKPVLVDFFAEWCGPCKMMGPILIKVKEALGDDAKIIKIDVDKNQKAAMQFQVQSVPTLMLFKNGETLWRQSGVVQAKELVELLKSHQ
jgi:thioredoxin 1